MIINTISHSHTNEKADTYSLHHSSSNLTLNAAEEHLAELMPIFEELRAKGEVGNAYPMHVGSTSGPTVHMAHANPNTCHWVMSDINQNHLYHSF